MDHRHIPQAWIIRPNFQHWPPQRQSPQAWTIRPDFQHWSPHSQYAVFWIMAHLVQYRLLTQRRLSPLDYVDFMCRARWKLYHHSRRPRVTGWYLDVIDWPRYWSEPFYSVMSLPRYSWGFFTFRIPRLEDILHKPTCLIHVSLTHAMKNPTYKK